MFSKNIKSMLIIIMSLVLSFSSVVLYAECDMVAMLTKSGYIIPNITNGPNSFDYSEEVFQFLIDRSGPYTYPDWLNEDGYGVIYYKDGETIVPTSQRFHQVGFGTYYQTHPQQMDDAKIAIENTDNEAVIVLGHDRNTSQNAYGNHPFWFEVDNDNNGTIDQTYTFQHNGDCSDLREGMMDYLDDKYGEQWFMDHPSNWGATYNNPSQWIDSELLFHFIMAHIFEYNGDVVGGIIGALNYNGEFGDFASNFHNQWSANSINFVLSDGNGLYAFRNNTSRNLSYKCFNDAFVALKTQDIITNGIQIQQFSLVEIPRNSEIVTYENIFGLDAKLFASGVTWSSCPRLTEQGIFNNEIFEQAYWNVLEQTPGFLQETFQGAPTITDFDIIYGHRNGNDIEIDYDVTDFIDDDFDNMLFRHEGYKIVVTEGADPTVLIVDGDRLDSYSIEYMPALENFWLGYYIPYSQNIKDAFGYGAPNPEDDFWNDVNRVWAEDWYYDAHYIQRGDPTQLASNSTIGKTMEYGKMYIVQMYYNVENFSWNGSSTAEEPIRKATPENFSYTEKADYEVIDVVSIPSNVTEIGVFEEDICVGAIAVEDSCAQILVYSDSANRDPIPFTFEIVTGRGLSTLIKDYLVLNMMTGEFESSVIISGRQEYSAIKFGEQEEPENIVSKPVLKGNYPNPFNPTTTISFSLPTEQDIELTIYNIKGQKVKTLYSGTADVGDHTIIWEGKDTNDKPVSSGIYFYKLTTNNKELTRKMLMMK